MIIALFSINSEADWCIVPPAGYWVHNEYGNPADRFLQGWIALEFEGVGW